MRSAIIVLFGVSCAVGCSQSSPAGPEALSGPASTSIVVPEPGDVGGRPLTAAMMTENEVPTCTEPPPPARGSATFSINMGQSKICWVIDVMEASAPFVGLHIHEDP